MEGEMSFLLLGLDSLIACLAIGTVVGRRARLPLAALFGVADGGAFLLGAGAGWHVSDSASIVLQTGMLVGIGLYLLVVAANRQRLAGLSVWAVPFALTLDNLTFGLVGDRSASSLVGQAGQQALSSSLLALIGLLVAVELPRLFPALQNRVTATRMAGGALVLAAGVELLIS
jgi:hypothetical protein